MNAEVQKLELIQLILTLQDNQVLLKIEQLLKGEAAATAVHPPKTGVAEKQALVNIQRGAEEVRLHLDGKKQLQSLQSLIDAMRMDMEIRDKKPAAPDPFAETFGIWEDRDFDIEQFRESAWQKAN